MSSVLTVTNTNPAQAPSNHRESNSVYRQIEIHVTNHPDLNPTPKPATRPLEPEGRGIAGADARGTLHPLSPGRQLGGRRTGYPQHLPPGPGHLPASRPRPGRSARPGRPTLRCPGIQGPGTTPGRILDYKRKPFPPNGPAGGPRRKSQTQPLPPAQRSMSGVVLRTPSDKRWAGTCPSQCASA